MSIKTIVLLAVASVIAIFGLAYCGTALSYRSSCYQAENGIKAQYKQNQNNYDNMWKKFREMSQIPEQYRDDLKKLYDSTMSARYGKEGSKAMFQWLKEHNPDLDASVYTKLQTAIEAGRNSFEAEQKQLLAKKQAYENVLDSNTALIVSFWFNYPTINLDDYDIVTSERTEETFKSGKADEIKLR